MNISKTSKNNDNPEKKERKKRLVKSLLPGENIVAVDGDTSAEEEEPQFEVE